MENGEPQSLAVPAVGPRAEQAVGRKPGWVPRSGQLPGGVHAAPAGR